MKRLLALVTVLCCAPVLAAPQPLTIVHAQTSEQLGANERAVQIVGVDTLPASDKEAMFPGVRRIDFSVLDANGASVKRSLWLTTAACTRYLFVADATADLAIRVTAREVMPDCDAQDQHMRAAQLERTWNSKASNYELINGYRRKLRGDQYSYGQGIAPSKINAKPSLDDY